MKVNRSSKKFQVTEDIISLSLFKAQAAKILHKLHESGRPRVITQNGKASAVVINTEEFDRLQESEEFIAGVEEGRVDAKAGRVLADEELEEQLDQHLGKLRCN